MAEVTLSLQGKHLADIPLTKKEMIIGRDPECDIYIDNIGISRSHARISFDDREFTVYDHRSSNGTFVNGSQIDTRVLNGGDEIQLGKYSLSFSRTKGPGDPTEESGKINRLDVGEMNVGSEGGMGTYEFTPNDIRKLLRYAKQSEPSGVETEKEVKAIDASGDDVQTLVRQNRLLLGLLIGVIILLLILVVFSLAR